MINNDQDTENLSILSKAHAYDEPFPFQVNNS